ncbi:unannotated protein [freshwater metagenome]|uniref:Unannotated protein n=1 Tax=freshwater metagenome TaxID=449393 RepID=A0A6J6V1A8_9ZZZZ
MMSELGPTAIGVIGAGIMGEALISALITSGVQPSMVTISEKREDRANELIAKYGVRSASLAENVSQAQALLLVVKPQDMGSLLDEIKKSLKPETLIVTFAAGKKISFIASHLDGAHPIIRVMPNTPALVGEGMAAISPGPNVSNSHTQFVRDFLEATGRVVEVEEDLQDAVTAMSGSGPAYFFAFIEAMVSAGEELGLSHEVATELSVQTMVGASKLLTTSGKSATILRENVTSPKGTTAAGLASFNQANFTQIIKDAIRAARDRSQELA